MSAVVFLNGQLSNRPVCNFQLSHPSLLRILTSASYKLVISRAFWLASLYSLILGPLVFSTEKCILGIKSGTEAAVNCASDDLTCQSLTISLIPISLLLLYLRRPVQLHPQHQKVLKRPAFILQGMRSRLLLLAKRSYLLRPTQL